MKHNSLTDTRQLVLIALFTALTCVSTMVIRIPTPGTGGYIHPGDSFVILSGLLLGPVGGLLAGGFGSALSDLFGGYLLYVPITFVIKGCSAFLSGLLSQTFLSHHKTRSVIPVILGGLINFLLVVAGYFLCELPLYGVGAASASIPSNIVQCVGGLLIALFLYPFVTPLAHISNRNIH